MRKKTSRRLALHRETLRQLSAPELRQAHGASAKLTDCRECETLGQGCPTSGYPEICDSDVEVVVAG